MNDEPKTTEVTPKKMDHKIAVHLGGERIILSVDSLRTFKGDRVKWDSRGPQEYSIKFKTGSPFEKDELNPNELVGFIDVVNEGSFEYMICDFPARRYCLDPAIVVDPPTP
jgi:hypothetical protein